MKITNLALSIFSDKGCISSMYDEKVGMVDQEVIEAQVAKDLSIKKRSSYIHWSDSNRYKVGKYASQNEIAAAVRHFKTQFPKLNESTARGFKNG